MGVRAHRQPVDAAVLIHEAVEVGIVNGTRLVAGGEIHQAVLQRLCVMERKPAAGDHIRQPTVFIEEFVEIQIVVSHHKFHVHVWELGLNVGGVLFIQVRVHKYTRMGSPSSSAVLPAQPARRKTLIASVSSSAAIRLHLLSFIGHCPFKKSVLPACFCPQKNTFRTWNTHIRKCFVLSISGFGHRKYAERSLRSFDRSCRQIAPCLSAPAFQKSAKRRVRQK